MTDIEELADELEVDGGELAVLKREKEALTRELKSRDARIIGLEQTVAGKDSEIAVSKQAVTEAEAKLAEFSNVLTQAVASYKSLVIESNPGVLAELITRDTVDHVNESLENARVLVDKVRQEMEVEASKTKIPAGAPQRAALDLSALSSREKIQYAIGGTSP